MGRILRNLPSKTVIIVVGFCTLRSYLWNFHLTTNTMLLVVEGRESLKAFVGTGVRRFCLVAHGICYLSLLSSCT